MDLNIIKDIFQKMGNFDWEIALIKFRETKKNGIEFFCRKIVLDPYDKLSGLVKDISELYTSDLLENKYQQVKPYEGSCDAQVIYRLPCSDKLIKDAFEKLVESISHSDVEEDPFKLKAQAYVIYADLVEEGVAKPIKMISVKNPTTILKHKFFADKGSFKELPEKVLTLRTSIDLVIYDGYVYFFDMSGEKLFALERTYTIKCRKDAKLIRDSCILSNPDFFYEYAQKGHNPRRFLSFNEGSLESLASKKIRRRLAKKFGLRIKDDLFVTDTSEEVTQLVKVLCNKGALDPFGEDAMEVAGMEKWG